MSPERGSRSMQYHLVATWEKAKRASKRCGLKSTLRIKGPQSRSRYSDWRAPTALRTEGKGGDLRIVSGVSGRGVHGAAKTGQGTYQGGGSVVPSRIIHACSSRQQV